MINLILAQVKQGSSVPMFILIFIILIVFFILFKSKSKFGVPSVKVDELPANRYRYPVLRTIAGLLKFFAVGLVFTTISVSIGVFKDKDELISIAIIIAILIGLFLWMSSEIIKVVLDIEYNTRKSAERD